jgi:hypothetical protein
MIKRDSANERVKRRYLQHLKETKGRDESSLDAVAKAIDRFEEYSKFRDFKKFHVEQVRLQGASKGDAERENRPTFIGVDHLLDICSTKGLFRMALPGAGLSVADQAGGRRIFQFPRQPLESCNSSPI